MTRRPDIHRILVALDASPHSLAALQQAAEMAARLRAELIGLFVEDINLLRLAELDVAREFQLVRGNFEITPGLPGMENQLRALATRARRAFEEAGRRSGVPHRFRIARGQVARELIAAAAEADLLILGWASQAPPGLPLPSPRLGATARSVARGAGRSVLLLRSGARFVRPALVVYDGTISAARALAAAISMTDGGHELLNILAVGDDVDEIRERQTRVRAWLRRRRIDANIGTMRAPTPARIAALLRQSGCLTLVVHAESPLLSGEPGATLLDAIECPVLIVR
ncbi:MAG: universal stress protein [Alphaproteobacteria bacterium]